MTERPERDERDVDAEFDAEFAAIIARWDDAPAVPVRERAAAPEGDDPGEDDPATEGAAEGDDVADGDVLEREAHRRPDDDPADSPDPADPAATADPAGPTGTAVPDLGSIPVWRGAQVTPEQAHDFRAREEELDHYDPPPPRPLPPQEDLSFWGIILGLVGGPLLLLWLVIFRPDVSRWWTFAALGLTVAGFVLLVLRQPHSREDDPDDGAVV